MESHPNQRGSTCGFSIKNGSIKELSMVLSIENPQVLLSEPNMTEILVTGLLTAMHQSMIFFIKLLAVKL